MPYAAIGNALVINISEDAVFPVVPVFSDAESTESPSLDFFDSTPPTFATFFDVVSAAAPNDDRRPPA